MQGTTIGVVKGDTSLDNGSYVGNKAGIHGTNQADLGPTSLWQLRSGLSKFPRTSGIWGCFTSELAFSFRLLRAAATAALRDCVPPSILNLCCKRFGNLW